MKKKIINAVVDVLLIAAVFAITDAVMLNVLRSESFWLEFGVYAVFYFTVFGIKGGVVALWKKHISEKKEGNDNEKDQ